MYFDSETDFLAHVKSEYGITGDLDQVLEQLDDESVTYLTQEQLQVEYDDSFDDVQIGSLSYTGARVLREVDPIAYRVGYSDYVDSLAEDYLVMDF